MKQTAKTLDGKRNIKSPRSIIIPIHLTPGELLPSQKKKFLLKQNRLWTRLTSLRIPNPELIIKRKIARLRGCLFFLLRT